MSVRHDGAVRQTTGPMDSMEWQWFIDARAPTLPHPDVRCALIGRTARIAAMSGGQGDRWGKAASTNVYVP
jgi:hypothetical protein